MHPYVDLWRIPEGTCTAGAQLYAVTMEDEPLDAGVGAALFLTWTALVIVVGALLFQRRDVG